MRHVTPFLIKFAMTTVILWIVLGIFYNASIGNILIISLLLSIISYIADVFVLPNVSYFWATIGDFGLAFIGIWFLGNYVFEGTTAVEDAALISAAIIAIGEILFHRYMKQNVFEDIKLVTPRELAISNRLQTEFSKELDEKDKKE
ncbi:hypothetical protein GCM10008025_25380 [Ornithinibacillus halotolerans]|uniref:DUF2512 family protein n=1 Tax=Ornithinibacillus halotolerans TaxID=1274357 RepID=A0A916S3H7_9BACI|nr:hypothetical protein GCM10008025_25380 [Ornithinibacillus halotolerans]